MDQSGEGSLSEIVEQKGWEERALKTFGMVQYSIYSKQV